MPEFYNPSKNLIRECIPGKEVVIRPNDKPWYDSIIRSTSRKRDRMKRKATKSDKSEDWHKYKQLRNKVNNLKKHAKEKFYNNIENEIIEANTNNTELYWKLIKHFIKSNKNSEKNTAFKDKNTFWGKYICFYRFGKSKLYE